MEKIIVIGSPGAGKSTFSRGLRDITGLELYYLDMIWHRADKTNITPEEFDARLCEILQNMRGIIDGNYSRTIERRIQWCDTVFLFDLPTNVCLDGVRARIGAAREDLPWVESTLDEEFAQYITDFGKLQLPQIYALLEKYKGKNTVIFKSREQADEYLHTLALQRRENVVQ